MTTHTLFGTKVKGYRADVCMGLREFCLQTGYDPANWSKIERGLLKPPIDAETMSKIGYVLELSMAKQEELLNLAHIDREKLPPAITEDEYIMSMLPAFIKTASGLKPSRECLDGILQLLREDWLRIQQYNETN